MYFIIHPKSLTGHYNYSIIREDKLNIVPKEAIYKKKKIVDRPYSKEELEQMRDKLIALK